MKYLNLNFNTCIFTGNEFCERLAYYGMSSNLVNYFEQRLNQGTTAASNNVTNWGGTCYITPLLGAFIADAYLGRYWTIATFSSIYVLVIHCSELLFDVCVYISLPNDSLSTVHSLSVCSTLHPCMYLFMLKLCLFFSTLNQLYCIVGLT